MPSLPSRRRARTSLRGSFATPPQELTFLRTRAGLADPQRPVCVHCGRTPLIGEVVHVYASARQERHVCALCRDRHDEPPARSEIVHSSEHHRAVKARTRAA
jgi:hypothetical protein